MKKYYLYSLILALTFSSIFYKCATTSNRSNAKIEILEAEKVLEKLEKDELLIDFIPSKNYFEAKNNIELAYIKFNNDKDYDIASYYAVLSTVETETARTIAKTKLAKQKKLKLERDYYSAETLKIAILKANLKKEGQSYKGILFDNNIFIKRNKFVLTKSGKNILNKIYDVLKVYPESRITIVGHTKWKDRNNILSLKKAEAVNVYLKEIKGLDSQRILVKGMGNSYPMEVKKKMRTLDRVEVIISGIQ